MEYVHIIDENGFYKESDFVEEITSFTIEVELPSGFFYTPRWNGESWEEGATQEYIDSLKSEPQELPLEEKNRADIDYLAVMTGVEL